MYTMVTRSPYTAVTVSSEPFIHLLILYRGNCNWITIYRGIVLTVSGTGKLSKLQDHNGDVVLEDREDL